MDVRESARYINGQVHAARTLTPYSADEWAVPLSAITVFLLLGVLIRGTFRRADDVKEVPHVSQTTARMRLERRSCGRVEARPGLSARPFIHCEEESFKDAALGLRAVVGARRKSPFLVLVWIAIA